MDREKLQKTYREYFESYDVISKYATCYQELKASHLNKTLAYSFENEWVLDLGCGTGNLTLDLVKNKRKVVAIDISEDMLSLLKLKMKGLKRYEIILGDIASPKFPKITKKFKVINMMNVFYHLKNPSKYLRKIFKLLQKDGVLIISGPAKNISSEKLFKEIKKDLVEQNLFKKYNKEYRIVSKINKTKLIPGANLYDETSLRKLAEKEGFKMTLYDDKFYYGHNYLAVFKKILN